MRYDQVATDLLMTNLLKRFKQSGLNLFLNACMVNNQDIQDTRQM